MAVKWAKIFETSTTGKMPTNAQNVWSEGINAGGGLVEFVQLRYDLTFADTPCALTEISSLISGLRIVLNGEVVHDFTAGFASNAAEGPSQYNYLINHIGGRCVEEPNQTAAKTRVGYINIPLGRPTPQGVNRYEIIVQWAAAAQAIDTGSMSYWIRYNDNAQTTTTVVPSTSFNASIANQQVVVRVPQNVPAGSVVSSLFIFNDSADDQYASQGIRINALSDFGIPISMLRSNNGDLVNGLYWNQGSTSVDDVQTRATRLSGAIMIPCFGLTGGDLQTQVDSSAATTRQFLPVLTAPVGGKANEPVRQSQTVVGNTAKATLDGSLM